MRKKNPHEDISRERTNKDKPFKNLSVHTLAHDLKTAEAQAGLKQKLPERFCPTKAPIPRPHLSRQGPPLQQVLSLVLHRVCLPAHYFIKSHFQITGLVSLYIWA